MVALRRFAPVYRTPSAARRLRLTSTSDWSVPGLSGGELVGSDGDLLLVAAGRLDPGVLADA